MATTELLQLYRRMQLIRKFEERVSSLYAKNRIPGFVHLYIGQEAVAVGICSALNENDFITSTHRGHGHIIAKGGDVRKMMAELYGKANGYCKGKGGSMHITDMSIGVLGANGIVAGGMPIALGAAYGAMKIRNTKQVVVPFFGDGATGEGPFWEALNTACAWKLPIIFVCENNLYGVSTRLGAVAINEDISSRINGFELPVEVVSGNDVFEVAEAAERAVKRARNGEGPTFLECKTWRHHGHFEGENPSYFDDAEYQKWLRKDPILICEKRLLEKNGTGEGELEVIKNEIVDLIDEAVEFAENGIFPEPEDALQDIFN